MFNETAGYRVVISYIIHNNVNYKLACTRISHMRFNIGLFNVGGTSAWYAFYFFLQALFY